MIFIMLLLISMSNLVFASTDEDLLKRLIPNAYYSENSENTPEAKNFFLSVLRELYNLKVPGTFLDQEEDWAIGQEIIDT